MKVYEAIKTCTVSYREIDKMDIVVTCPSNDFVLYPGDFIFIDVAGWILSENKRYYRPINKLTKIYHNKLVNLDGDKEWTWINGLDVIEPKINKVLDPEYACVISSSPIDTLLLKEVTTAWVRDLKLKELGC